MQGLRIKKYLYSEKAFILQGSTIYTPILALFSVAHILKQSKHPRRGDWIKKPWYLFMTRYYLMIRTHEIIIFDICISLKYHNEERKSDGEVKIQNSLSHLLDIKKQ